MLSRICAGWLVLLILLPFSAPFSTCDLRIILAGAQDATHPPGPVTQALAAQNAATHVLPHSRYEHRDQWLASHVESPLAPRVRLVSRAPRGMTAPTIVSSPILQPLRI